MLLQHLAGFKVLVPVGLTLSRQNLVCFSLFHVSLHLLEVLKLFVLVLVSAFQGRLVWSIRLILLPFIVLIFSANLGHEIGNGLVFGVDLLLVVEVHMLGHVA